MLKRRFCLPVILVLWCFFLPFAQAATLPADPSLRLRGLESFVGKMLGEWKVPGAAVAVVSGDKVILARGYGLRDIENKLPATAETLYAIGSCTKAFTAATLAILVDEGRLEWDKPVRSSMPSFRLSDAVASDRLTARDLISHRSGLPRHDQVWYSSTFSRQELFERFQHLAFSKDLRQLYQYNNLMFMAAGCLVEKLTGVSWEEFTRQHILQPLDMSRTNFSVTDSQKARDFAWPYRERKNQVGRIPFHNIDAIGPAGSVNSCVSDMARWIQLNLNKGKWGEKQIVSEANLGQLHMPQMVISQPLRYEELFYGSYGLGWNINAYRGQLMVSHGGSIDGFQAFVSLLPQKGFGLVVLTNLAGNPLPTVIAYNIWDRLLDLDPVDWSSRIKEERTKAREQEEKTKAEEEKERRADKGPSHPLADFAGSYSHPGYGTLVVEQEGDGLKGRFNEIPFVLSHFHFDVFRIQNEDLGVDYRIRFQGGLKGDIESFRIKLEPTVEDILFTRVPDEIKQTEGSIK